jgi:pimeloyl-ACP methyl ester carboxylesterase
LLALIAPNALLLSSSIREGDGDPWAIEQGYHSVSSVYRFLKVPEKLGVRLRDGEHAVEARELEGYMDWLDIQFKRKNLPWENKLFYGYSFDKWKSLSKEALDMKNFPDATATAGFLLSRAGKNIKDPNDWNVKKSEILKQVEWILGTEPPGLRANPIIALTPESDYLASFMSRPVVKNGRKINIAPYNAMGDYLHASLYYPAGADGKMTTKQNGKVPVVIYLHNFSNTGFDSQLNRLFESVLSKGIAVLAFDLLGYGTRIEEGTLFYDRYPNWSKLGKMVADARAAIDALESIEFVDKENIFLSGYSLGGTVSLFTAALDNRVAGVAVSCAFTPWRDSGNKNLEGIKAYSHLYGLLPRLGFFVGSESKVPVDFAEIISAIAPRRLLVIAPQLDRHANAEKTSGALQEVRSVYSFMSAAENFSISTPREFNQLTASQETDLVNWLDKAVTSK